MFNPTRDEVRRFFCESWRKRREAAPLTPMEGLAIDWIEAHPEYHDDLAVLDEALARDYAVDQGRANPFLHLSMHVAIAEQLSIDQPPGIRAAFDALCRRTGSAHDAAHEVMECLGETVWRAQRDNAVPDGAAYLACLRRRAGLAPG